MIQSDLTRWCSRPSLFFFTNLLHLFCLHLYALSSPNLYVCYNNKTTTQGFMRSSQNHKIQNTSPQRKERIILHEMSVLFVFPFVCMYCFDFFVCTCSHQVRMYTLLIGPIISRSFAPYLCSLELISVFFFPRLPEQYALEWIRLRLLERRGQNIWRLEALTLISICSEQIARVATT